MGFSKIQTELTNLPILPNYVKIKNPLKVLKFKILKFYFILEYFNFKLSTCWSQSNVFGVKSKDFSKIRKIWLFRQGISENLEGIFNLDKIRQIRQTIRQIRQNRQICKLSFNFGKPQMFVEIRLAWVIYQINKHVQMVQHLWFCIVSMVEHK